MINHVQNLLLNLKYDDDRSEGIPVGFVPFSYNTALRNVHTILVNPNLSRFMKKFVVYQYLRYLDAVGFSEDTKLIDPRVTYDFNVDKSEFFQFNRISNPKLIAPETPKDDDLEIELRIHGRYTSDTQLDNFYEKFKIQQIGSTGAIRAYSINSDEDVLHTYSTGSTLVFSGESSTGYSELVRLGNTGLSVSFYSPTDFTAVSASSSANKEWEFIAEEVIRFDITGIITSLENSSDYVEAMLRLKSKHDTSKYDSMWRLHFNPIYRLAGLIMAFVLRADNPDNRI